jgi:hypothetical protein
VHWPVPGKYWTISLPLELAFLCPTIVEVRSSIISLSSGPIIEDASDENSVRLKENNRKNV